MSAKKLKAGFCFGAMLSIVLYLLFLPSCSESKSSLSPATWEKGELERYLGQDEARHYGEAMRARETDCPTPPVPLS